METSLSCLGHCGERTNVVKAGEGEGNAVIWGIWFFGLAPIYRAFDYTCQQQWVGHNIDSTRYEAYAFIYFKVCDTELCTQYASILIKHDNKDNIKSYNAMKRVLLCR